MEQHQREIDTLDQQLFKAVQDVHRYFSKGLKTRQYVDDIEDLLRAGADLNAKDSNGKTALDYAIASQTKNESEGLAHRRFVALLLLTTAASSDKACGKERSSSNYLDKLTLHMSDLDEKDEKGCSSLHYAARYGKVEVVRTLLSAGASPNLSNNLVGNTPLLEVMGAEEISQDRRLEVAQLLIEAGADINTATSEQKTTSLHYACKRGDEKTVEWLLSHGASTAAVDKDGYNAVFLAAKMGKVQVMQLLIDSGAQVDEIKDLLMDYGSTFGSYPKAYTALFVAVEACRLDMVRYLLERGANPNIRGSLRDSALSHALKTSDFDRFSVIELLLSHGADMYYGGRHGSLFQDLISGRRIPETRIFLEHGLDLGRYRPQHPEDFSPLHMAIGMDTFGDLLSLLLKYNTEGQLDLEHVDEDGYSPLCLAARLEALNCMRLLLKSGANVDHADKFGCTPLEIELDRKDLRPGVIKILVEAGARTRSERFREKLKNLLSELESEEDDVNHRLEKIKFIIKHRFLYSAQNPSVTEPFGLDLSGASTKIRKYFEECEAEITRLKSIVGQNGTSLCDMLNADKNFYKLVRNDAVYKIFEEESLENTLPIYAEDLKRRFKDLVDEHYIWEKAVRKLGQYLSSLTVEHREDVYQHHRERAGADCVVDREVDQGIKAEKQSTDAELCKSEAKELEAKSLNDQLLEAVQDFTLNLSNNEEEQSDTLAAIQKLLQAGADPNARDSRGKTCLHYAALMQNKDDGALSLQIIDLLMSFEAGPNIVDHEGLTPLLLVVRSNHPKAQAIVENLINAEVDLRKRDSRGWTGLHYASHHGNLEVVKILLSHEVSTNAPRKGGNTPLLDVMSSTEISQEARVSIAKLLISSGANVNVANRGGETSLHLACELGDVESVKLLLSCRASHSAVDKDGENALLIAAKHGNLEVVKLLLGAGADVNFINRKGAQDRRNGSITALHVGVRNVNLEMLKFLFEHGADPNCANGLGKSLLNMALNAEYDPSHAMLRLVLTYGADMYDGGLDRPCPFDHILSDGTSAQMRILFQHGLDLGRYKIQDGHAYLSPLHLGVGREDDLLSFLLEQYSAIDSLNLEHEDNLGRTPLILAVLCRSPECIRLLLRAGADVNHVWWNHTPLELVVCGESGSGFDSFKPECVRLLVEAGAKIEGILGKILSLASDDNIREEDCADESYHRSNSNRAYCLEKARCLIKYRALYESRQSAVKESIENEDLGGSDELREFYEACKNEINLMKKSILRNPMSYYDTLSADEDFKKRVRDELLLYRSLDEQTLQNQFPVYGEDLYDSLKNFGYLQNLGEKTVK